MAGGKWCAAACGRPGAAGFKKGVRFVSDSSISFFKADLRSFEFTLYEHLHVEQLFEHDYFGHLTREDCDQVLQQCLRFCDEATGPLNSGGDRCGCRLEDGTVTTPEGFKEAWATLYELGLPNFTASLEAGGFQGPVAVAVLLGGLQCGANCSFNMYPALTGGALELIAEFGTEGEKKRFAEPMMNGRFSGTMCLSEPQAGSDVGAITTKAVHVEGSRYMIEGSKCWISAGDHDMAENVVHMVLARAHGAPDGTKGISLFIVPKFRVDEDGKCGEANDVVTASIENKLGIHASTTAVLNFGDNGACEAFLVGARENSGMKQMFQMMNGARIGVGVQGFGVASTAYLNALAYARERMQGTSVKAFKDPAAPRVAIIEHSDVRRMLMEMKSKVEGMQSLCVRLGLHVDLATALAATDADAAAFHQGQADLLTPILKAYCSDQAFKVCELAIQVYGGAGYVKDNPVEQYLRDSKIFSIYEGTNHIQALDLVVRKLRGRKGRDLADYSGTLSKFVEDNSSDPAVGGEVRQLSRAVQALEEAGTAVVGYMMTGKLDQLTLCATPFLNAMGHVTIAHLLLEAGLVAEEARTQDDEQSQEEFDFYAGKVMSAKFYANFVLPEVFSLCEAIKSGDRSALDVPDRGFSSAW